LKRITEFALADGSTILVESDEPGSQGSVVRGLGAAEAAQKTGKVLEESLDKIKPAASAILAKLRDLTEPPEQVGLEFGIKLSAAAGAFIASAASEANFKVTLAWKRQPKNT